MENQKKIAAKDFKGGAILTRPETETSLKLGIIGGIATAIAKTEAPDGSVVEGLRGAFRFEDAAGSSITAPVLYMPGGLDDDVKALVKGGASSVKFVYELTANRVAGGAGYDFTAAPLRDLVKAEEADPVAALFDSVKPKPETAVDKAPKTKA